MRFAGYRDIFVTKSRLGRWALRAGAVHDARLLAQWLASERAGRSVIPVAFWWFSIAGGLLLLVYALYARTRSSSLARVRVFVSA